MYVLPLRLGVPDARVLTYWQSNGHTVSRASLLPTSDYVRCPVCLLAATRLDEWLCSAERLLCGGCVSVCPFVGG